ncbi:YigZ family protein [Mycoplasma marinum]|uniref:Proline dipeptidase n=1 Tax=Mycoplasma marinum TaxID=1937190 RepID=A0A4R0XM51_9MOLU|nr:YigZ family protein [Mycoplasma marinum]TCG11779.1 proline dipeptidase [Mycoplasma marinum]
MFLYEIKKSKFIAYSFEVHSKDDVDHYLKNIRDKYSDARHICYAYLIKSGLEMAGMSDDGEPKGTAGKPIFNIIKLKKKENILVIVVRYFGGKKLGASGLIRAYVAASKEVI